MVITGGGTAGHVIPSLPVAQALVAAGSAVHFVGGTSGLEERLVAPLGIPFHGIQTGKLRRYFSFENFIDALRIPSASGRPGASWGAFNPPWCSPRVASCRFPSSSAPG